MAQVHYTRLAGVERLERRSALKNPRHKSSKVTAPPGAAVSCNGPLGIWLLQSGSGSASKILAARSPPGVQQGRACWARRSEGET